MKAIHVHREGWYWCRRDHGGRLVTMGPFRSREEAERHDRNNVWSRSTRPNQLSHRTKRYMKSQL